MSDPNSPGAKTKHASDRTVPTLKALRPLLKAARRLLDEVQYLWSRPAWTLLLKA